VLTKRFLLNPYSIYSCCAKNVVIWQKKFEINEKREKKCMREKNKKQKDEANIVN
jgi:hypothetical protein